MRQEKKKLLSKKILLLMNAPVGFVSRKDVDWSGRGQGRGAVAAPGGRGKDHTWWGSHARRRQRCHQVANSLLPLLPLLTHAGVKNAKGRDASIPAGVDITPLGTFPSNVSPMTGQTGQDMDTIEGSSVGTASSSLIDSNEAIAKMLEDDEKQSGDGGTSDAEGEGFDIVNDFQDAMASVDCDCNQSEHDIIEDDIADDDINCHVMEAIESAMCGIDGAPEGWLPPKAPDNWMHMPSMAKGEPPFASIENPGNWSDFTFRPKFDKGTYSHHEMPAGAVPVKKDPVTGKRMHRGYEFFYDGWMLTDSNPQYSCQGAMKDNMFPDNRDCILDGALLKQLGLTKKRMDAKDALFFYQLLVPFVDPIQSGIEGNPRIGYYEEVSIHTNVYAMGVKNHGGTRGHLFCPVTAEELVKWDGIVARNVNKNIAECWMPSHTNGFDPVINEAMSPCR